MISPSFATSAIIPSLFISEATALTIALLISDAITAPAPAELKATASAFPMPLAAPVIATRLPFTSIAVLCIKWFQIH